MCFFHLCHEGADEVVLKEFGDVGDQPGSSVSLEVDVGEERWRIVIDVSDDDVEQH